MQLSTTPLEGPNRLTSRVFWTFELRIRPTPARLVFTSLAWARHLASYAPRLCRQDFEERGLDSSI